MNSILIRSSKNPLKPKSYACFFYKGETNKDSKLIASHCTPNGSIVDLGRVVMNYLRDGAIPSDSIMRQQN